MNSPTNYLLIILFVLLVIPSMSQESVKRNILIIIVQDQIGNVISNADIALVKHNGRTLQTKTNEEGVAKLTGVESGKWKVVIKSAGFLEYQNENFEMQVENTTKLTVVLEIAPIESKVEVSSEDEVDDYGMVTILTQEDIQKLPDDPEEFLRALRRIAGDSITGEALPIRVNEITGERIPPKQLIDQIRIDRNAFSAKYSDTGGAGIQIYTNTSTNVFRGFANFGFANSRLNAKNPFLGQRIPYQSYNYSLGLSGPLGKKSTFSISVNRGVRASSSVINAVGLNSNLQPTEFKQSFPQQNRNNQISLSLNSSLTKKQKVNFNLNLGSNEGTGQGVGGFALPERNSRSSLLTSSLSILHTYLPNENVVTRSRLIARSNVNKLSGESKSPAINVAEAFFAGGAPGNSTSKNLFFEFGSDTTKQLKKFSLEYGFSVRSISYNQDSQTNFNGTYSFNGRLAPLLDGANNPQLDANGNIIIGQITSLESYRRTLLFQRLGFSAIQIRELGGGASQFSISRGESKIGVSQIEYDMYLQGNYKPRNNLGISIGLRYENQNNIRSPFNLSPRFSLIWSPKNQKNTRQLWSLPRISAGAGINYSRFGIGNTLSIRQINDVGRGYYFLSAANTLDPVLSANILNAFPNVPSIEQLNQLSVLRSQRFLASGIQTPYDFTSNITLNKKLASKFNVAFSTTYVRGFRLQIARNINAPLAGTFDPRNISKAVYPLNSKGSVFQIDSLGKSETLRFLTDVFFPEVKFRNKSTQMSLRYSFVRHRDNIVFGSGSTFDAYDFSREFAPSTLDGIHTLTGNFNQELPYQINLGGNWGIRSGTRFNFTIGRDSNGDNYFEERPSFASDINKPGVIKTSYGWLDPNPASGDKIVPRNLGRGPSSFDFDIYLTKKILFDKGKDKSRLQRSLSMTIFVSNLFNINNKSNPIGNMASPLFLQILSSSTNNVNSNIGDSYRDSLYGSSPRSISFSVNFNF